MNVKICGITREEDARFCADSGASMLGFIFYAKSPRMIAPEAAARIIAGLPASVTPVGVFVNASRSEIEAVIRATGIRMLQLSGDESPAECAGYGIGVIKAFRFRNVQDAAKGRGYAVAAVLLDGAPDGVYGGSGRLADTSVALAMKEHAPLILAGGLGPDTILGAARAVAPFAVDVNSGVESSPGVKDHAKLALLFARVNEYHAHNHL